MLRPCCCYRIVIFSPFKRFYHQWNICKSVVYLDNNIVAINKPSGIAVHGGPGVSNELTSELIKLKFDCVEAPQLAHRIDRDTSGVLILSRNLSTARILAEWFHKRLIRKVYWAVVMGMPSQPHGTISVPTGYKPVGQRAGFTVTVICDESKTKWRSLKRSVTQYKVLKSCHKLGLSLVQATPITGHRHQVRVHFAHVLDSPIFGDTKYDNHRHHVRQSIRHLIMKGKHTDELKLHLHSKEIVLPTRRLTHYRNDITICAPLPHYFADTMKACGWMDTN
ncbi:pseudouridylate synthase RPUSD4, mitochondrial-like isoform X3 [Corticium candelabrum]|uniref:pseudouridylate synthase RPUSD4, mitochondrial-like isoform X3 n=1 Tax=Corticium candelabrum TaxID=121492 RepID=UPI002E25ABFD|nr:pseudouridylate synthase RPUSD4, mitochondrial-like isoform X3 [Corticium candelabrum]